MKRILPLAVFALAACQTAQPRVEVREVPVACVDPGEIPEEPPTVSHRFNGDARHDLQLLAPSAQAVRRWGQELRALLDRCVAGVPADEAAESDTVSEEG